MDDKEIEKKKVILKQTVVRRQKSKGEIKVGESVTIS